MWLLLQSGFSFAGECGHKCLGKSAAAFKIAPRYMFVRRLRTLRGNVTQQLRLRLARASLQRFCQVVYIFLVAVAAGGGVGFCSCFVFGAPVLCMKPPSLAARRSPLASRFSPLVSLALGRNYLSQVVSFWSFVLAANAGKRQALHLPSCYYVLIA